MAHQAPLFPAPPPAPQVGRLHVLTDRRLQTRFSHAELTRLAIEGGADVVQLRDKRLNQPNPPADLLGDLKAAVTASLAHSAHVLVNDAVDHALAIGAAGVHLGQEDEPLEQLFARTNRPRLVGATCHTLAELEAAQHWPLAYVGVGPVFGTTSKATGLPPLGLAGLRAFCQASRLPVVAIGGITPQNLAQVLDQGAWGVAVLGAFCLTGHPLAATQQLRAAIDHAQ